MKSSPATNYAHVDKLGKKLADGYRKTIAKVGLQAYIAQAGANGALMFYPKEIRNYRDWTRSMSISGATTGSPWSTAA